MLLPLIIRVPNTPRGRMATNIPSVMGSAADTVTTISPVAITIHGQIVVPRSPSSPCPESCIALRNIIEGLIREGKLDKYVHNLPPLSNPHKQQINMISTISGGPTLAGTSNNSIKHYV
ncbi:unnamed protein product [Prunus brigantina]